MTVKYHQTTNAKKQPASNALAQQMSQSSPFEARSDSATGPQQQPDLKTSLTQAERYGHTLGSMNSAVSAVPMQMASRIPRITPGAVPEDRSRYWFRINHPGRDINPPSRGPHNVISRYDHALGSNNPKQVETAHETYNNRWDGVNSAGDVNAALADPTRRRAMSQRLAHHAQSSQNSPLISGVTDRPGPSQLGFSQSQNRPIDVYRVPHRNIIENPRNTAERESFLWRNVQGSGYLGNLNLGHYRAAVQQGVPHNLAIRASTGNRPSRIPLPRR